VEAKAHHLKPSTYESYSNSMKAFVAFLGHDDSSRVTAEQVCMRSAVENSRDMA
jgi:hypothetical protein